MQNNSSFTDPGARAASIASSMAVPPPSSRPDRLCSSSTLYDHRGRCRRLPSPFFDINLLREHERRVKFFRRKIEIERDTPASTSLAETCHALSIYIYAIDRHISCNGVSHLLRIRDIRILRQFQMCDKDRSRLR